MATISDLKKIKPSWELANKVEVTENGIEIRALENEKRIFAIKDKHKNLSKKQFNRLLLTCRQDAIKYFITHFDKEPFAELWSYSHKSKIICEARVPSLLRNKADELKSYLESESPDGYSVILSFKENNPQGIEEHEKFVHRTTRTSKNDAFLSVEPDTVEYIYLKTLSQLIPPMEFRSVLWDAHETESLKKLADKLQFIPLTVYNRTIDLARKRSSRKDIDNHIIPVFVSLSDDKNEKLDRESTIDPRINNSNFPDIEFVCSFSEIETFINKLTERQQQVINMRYRKDLNLTQVAEKLGIAKQTVSEIETAAIKKLKRLLKSKTTLISNLDSKK